MKLIVVLKKGRSKNCTIYFSLILTFFVKAGETTAGEMMAGDNEPSQNDDDLDIVNEDTNQGTLSYFKIIKTIYTGLFLSIYQKSLNIHPLALQRYALS